MHRQVLEARLGLQCQLDRFHLRVLGGLQVRLPPLVPEVLPDRGHPRVLGGLLVHAHREIPEALQALLARLAPEALQGRADNSRNSRLRLCQNRYTPLDGDVYRNDHRIAGCSSRCHNHCICSIQFLLFCDVKHPMPFVGYLTLFWYCRSVDVHVHIVCVNGIGIPHLRLLLHPVQDLAG